MPVSPEFVFNKTDVKIIVNPTVHRLKVEEGDISKLIINEAGIYLYIRRYRDVNTFSVA